MTTPQTTPELPEPLLELINNYTRACTVYGSPAWECAAGKTLIAALAARVTAAPQEGVSAPEVPARWQGGLSNEQFRAEWTKKLPGVVPSPSEEAAFALGIEVGALLPSADPHAVAPAFCPITNRPFWGNLDHPKLGRVATYGGPFDTYTIPAIEDDGELRSERYDQDAGRWVEGGEPIGWFYQDQQAAPEPPQPLSIGLDATVIRRVIHELRTYNPAADEYKGAHIHGVWAKELQSVLAAAPQPPASALPLAVGVEGDDEAKHRAWSEVREQLGTSNWSTGEAATFYGFFGWGWQYRGQLEKQRVSAPPPLSPPDTGNVGADDLAMLVKQLAHSLRKAAPDSTLPEKAMDYLKRKDLLGSVLRTANDPTGPIGEFEATMRLRWLKSLIEKQQDSNSEEGRIDQDTGSWEGPEWVTTVHEELDSLYEAAVASKGHRFQETYCSQCGGKFGPGDGGYSHCSAHVAALPPPGRGMVPLTDFHRDAIWQRYCPGEDFTPARQAFSKGIEEAHGIKEGS